MQGGTRGTAGPVTLDLETTGLRRWDQIVSAGMLVDGVAYLLFLRSLHSRVTNVPVAQFRSALEPLGRPDLVLVGHNLPFDLGFLWREGIRTFGECRDTLKMLRLLDQDRGREGGQGMGRLDLQAPVGAEPVLNYRLKDVARQLLGLKMPYFPGSIEWVPYAQHCKYLACDLLFPIFVLAKQHSSTSVLPRYRCLTGTFAPSFCTNANTCRRNALSFPISLLSPIKRP